MAEVESKWDEKKRFLDGELQKLEVTLANTFDRYVVVSIGVRSDDLCHTPQRHDWASLAYHPAINLLVVSKGKALGMIVFKREQSLFQKGEVEGEWGESKNG